MGMLEEIIAYKENRAFEKGRAKGYEIGKAEGYTEILSRCIKRLAKDHDVEAIAKLLKLPLSEVQEYLA